MLSYLKRKERPLLHMNHCSWYHLHVAQSVYLKSLYGHSLPLSCGCISGGEKCQTGLIFLVEDRWRSCIHLLHLQEQRYNFLIFLKNVMFSCWKVENAKREEWMKSPENACIRDVVFVTWQQVSWWCHRQHQHKNIYTGTRITGEQLSRLQIPHEGRGKTGSSSTSLFMSVAPTCDKPDLWTKHRVIFAMQCVVSMCWRHKKEKKIES